MTTTTADLGAYDPATDRPDPVALLESQAATRLPDLVPVRYGRMLVSPFTFFRGAALIMASDLSSCPRSDVQVQLCGDAHLSNFGAFASPERRLVFDINDFDETNPGPFEWDVKRLVTSIEVAGRDRHFTKKERLEALRSTCAGYADAIRDLSQQANLDLWYASIDVDAVVTSLQPQMDKTAKKRSGRALEKARTRNSLQAAAKLTTVVDGVRRFIDSPPVIVRAETLLEVGSDQHADVIATISAAWEEYLASLQADRRHLLQSYAYVDLARKVVGVGSVGTRAWVMLLQGHDESDLLILQVKEAQASVLEAFTRPSCYVEHGQRVVEGQRLLQSSSDIFLGWNHLGDVDYYVRQLRDWKASVDVDALDIAGLVSYGQLCGATLAKGHARSGDRAAIAAFIADREEFTEAMVTFARAYADQNERDYASLQAAAADGRITATAGV